MTLLEQFAEYGFRQLIPKNYDYRTGLKNSNNPFDRYDGSSYNYSYTQKPMEYEDDYSDNYSYEPKQHTDDRYRYRSYNEYDPAWESMYHDNQLETTYYDDYDDDEYDYEEFEDAGGADIDDPDRFRPKDLEDLKIKFEKEYMSDEEFLMLSPADLFNVSKSQLKFIDIDILLTGSVERFAEIMKDATVAEDIPDIQQRIKYATLCATQNIDRIVLPDLSVMPEEHRFTYTSQDRKNLNKYIIHNAINLTLEEGIRFFQILRDYYRLFPYACIMNLEKSENGDPTARYELFPKPSHIDDMHDKAYRNGSVIIDRMRQKSEEERTKQFEYVVYSKRYQKYLIRGRKYSIIAPKSLADIYDEGNKLNHCVDTYVSRFLDGDSFIYFLRENNNINKPYFTLEVGEDDSDHNSEMNPTGQYYLKQCYGRNNTTDKSDECRKFIRNWMHSRKLKLKCII